MDNIKLLTGDHSQFSTVTIFFNHLHIDRFRVTFICKDRRIASDILIKIAMNQIFRDLKEINLTARTGKYVIEIKSDNQFILNNGILEVYNDRK